MTSTQTLKLTAAEALADADNVIGRKLGSHGKILTVKAPHPASVAFTYETKSGGTGWIAYPAGRNLTIR